MDESAAAASMSSVFCEDSGEVLAISGLFSFVLFSVLYLVLFGFGLLPYAKRGDRFKKKRKRNEIK